MKEASNDKKPANAPEDHDDTTDQHAAAAGSESPEEGVAAMTAAEDAVIDNTDRQ